MITDLVKIICFILVVGVAISYPITWVFVILYFIVKADNEQRRMDRYIAYVAAREEAKHKYKASIITRGIQDATSNN